MSKQLEKVRKAENRTTSEFLREALRQCIERRYPTEAPIKEELVAIRRGRAAFVRGEHKSLTDVTNELETQSHKARTKRPRKLPSKDRARLLTALRSLEVDPFSGDIKRLQPAG